jgi:dienelactone hydrolase
MAYDPFLRGRFPVGVRTLELRDDARQRRFPVEIWYPAAVGHAGQDLAPATQDAFGIATGGVRKQSAVRDAEAEGGTYPLVVFSHASGHHRRGATYLCTHLASHGYVVAAMDHSEIVAPELGRRQEETADQKTARVRAIIASRVPDLRFLLDELIHRSAWKSAARLDFDRLAVAGHSFGGWTALAAPETEPSIRAVVALAPGGSSHPRPGLIPSKLSFDWGRDVPTLYLVAENDICVPLAGERELCARTPGTKRFFVLRRADHAHFMDHAEEEHEAARALAWTGELAWMAKEMRPITEFCSGDEAHRFTRGLALAHLDAWLRRMTAAQRFIANDPVAECAQRGVSALGG